MVFRRTGSLHMGVSQTFFAPVTGVLFAAVLLVGWSGSLPGAEQIYKDLAKLPEAERAKRLEEGARKEGKLNFVHTWRGQIAKDFVKAFEKHYSSIRVEMSDLGSQDAAERFIAEE